MIMRQSARSFVETIDFRTSPGNLGGAEQAERIRREGGWLGRGPTVVVTDLGIYHFGETGRDAARLAPPGRHRRGRPRHDRLGGGGRPRPCRHAGAERRRAAAHPRRARPGRRLHEVGAPERGWAEPAQDRAGDQPAEVDDELEGALVRDRDDEPADVRRGHPEVREREGERARDRDRPVDELRLGRDLDRLGDAVEGQVAGQRDVDGVPGSAAAGTATGCVSLNVAVG